ncbi:AGAP007991-PA-like protein [Anopheles sinensis]|uniref:AGAP007991-PA-like protein n=1 Tax=Anopheles sinensis TaxID=74873 RepID=A0A084WD64_ANOSI|nr:AGAP007991-PA-like protein [Anopheles sinensis]
MFNPDTIMNANFARGRPLIVLIHGYTGHRDYAPNPTIRPAYFAYDEFNIISVDYNPLALEPCYLQAVRNLPTVANCTAQLLDFIIGNNIIPLEDIHVVGFSLGGQTSGMIANYLKSGKLKRITGLDPAKPLFVFAPNEHKLDQMDAEFVQVIHTDVFQRGILHPSGHTDFYVNGGVEQPGCNATTMMTTGECNHNRAPEYYAESIASEVGFYGYRCAHWYLYMLGVCRGDGANQQVAIMGAHTPDTAGTPLGFRSTEGFSFWYRSSWIACITDRSVYPRTSNRVAMCRRFLTASLVVLSLFIPTILAQKQETNNVFNTTSCLEKPYRCPHPRIKFYLYTRRTQQKPELIDVLDPESLYYTHWNPSHPVKIVIHGFGGGRNLSPSPDMRKAYFTRGNYNIIIVDYGSAVTEPCLSQIEWAPRFGSLCVSQLVKYIANHPRGVPPDDMHLIGYSVGAHIAGLVANYLTPAEGKLGRITGLDPTIFFYAGSNNSRDLDPSDAHFVDIIHTGAGILGQWSPGGHADFYVNGGTSQPGCASSTIFQTLACDHTKVTPYFIESINSERGFWAGPCPTLISYLLGWCEPKDSDYVLMGEHLSRRARGVFYVTTNAKPPYARGFPGKNRRTAKNSDYAGVRRK